MRDQASSGEAPAWIEDAWEQITSQFEFYKNQIITTKDQDAKKELIKLLAWKFRLFFKSINLWNTGLQNIAYFLTQQASAIWDTHEWWNVPLDPRLMKFIKRRLFNENIQNNRQQNFREKPIYVKEGVFKMLETIQTWLAEIDGSSRSLLNEAFEIKDVTMPAEFGQFDEVYWENEWVIKNTTAKIKSLNKQKESKIEELEKIRRKKQERPE